MSIASIRRSYTRQKFQAFLDAQPPRKLAGEVLDCSTCPLAVYLGKQPKSGEVQVFASTWRFIPKGLENHPYTCPEKNNPKWAMRFIRKVDERFVWKGKTQRITFGTAAKILRDL